MKRFPDAKAQRDFDRQTLLRTQSGSFAFAREFVKGKYGIDFSYKIERQDYRRISESPTGAERRGTLHQFDLGWNYQLTPTMRFSNSIQHAHKHARKKFNSSDKMLVATSHTWILGKGQFLINAIDFGLENFKAFDGSVANRIRRDKSLRYRVTYGAPFGLLITGKLVPRKLVPEVFNDITFTLTYEYNRVQSTITNNQFRNNKYQILMTKNWAF